ncbi:MAG TPA: mreD [Rhabdochlamydiaceae bacterium]|nr:mreD [Rhabdochlamydiaceae bacterium]
MKPVPLYFPFLLALTMTLFGTVFFPNLRLIPFAPFLAIVFTRKTFINSLWLACLCGLIFDLLTSQFRLGLYALNYCLTTVLVYHQKRNFFEDKPLALSVFTVLVSCASTVLQLFLLYAFDQGLNLSMKLVLTDMIAMPILDGGYAFLWFALPMKLFKYVQKVGWKFLYRKL